MTSPLRSITQAGTKIWLDSVDPDLVLTNRDQGATGATSNPIIISDLIKSGRFDGQLQELLGEGGMTASEAAWALTDRVVASAQEVFLPVWESTSGDDGYVSFEVDPLLEDASCPFSHEEKVQKYIELGTQWSEGRKNRMIKVPATPAGLDALEELSARGVALNITLIFSMRQWAAARDAVWRGAQRSGALGRFKSVFSIFISRVDVYTHEHVPGLSPGAQGQVGLVNAKRMWRANRDFWSAHPTPLTQEMIFASTGAKLEGDAPWKYVEALVGSDIQTNPPATNEAVEASGRTFERTIDQLPPQAVLDEIDAEVGEAALESVLMAEGLKKFADPQKALLELIEQKRLAIAG